MKYLPSILLLAFATSTAQSAATNIMLLGDSITQGGTTNPTGYAQVGYRYDLYYDLKNADFNFDYIGTQTDVNNSFPDPAQYPDYSTTFDPHSEGHWGKTASFIDSQISTWLTQTPTPDIVLIHAGTNDIRNAPNTFNPALTTSTIASLSDTIRQIRLVNPDVAIYLASIIPFDDGGYSSAAYQMQISDLDAAIPNLAHSDSTASSPVNFVDQYDGFDDATMTYDGVHPNALGEAQMATVWFNALSESFVTPFAPAIPNPDQPTEFSPQVQTSQNHRPQSPRSLHV